MMFLPKIFAYQENDPQLSRADEYNVEIVRDNNDQVTIILHKVKENISGKASLALSGNDININSFEFGPHDEDKVQLFKEILAFESYLFEYISRKHVKKSSIHLKSHSDFHQQIALPTQIFRVD